jgi:hypothetical protein
MTRPAALATRVIGGTGAEIAARLAAVLAKDIISHLPGDVLQDAAKRLGLPAVGSDLDDAASMQMMTTQIAADQSAPDITSRYSRLWAQSGGRPREQSRGLSDLAESRTDNRPDHH